jgi:predicted ArsR family transcriptional regulator
MDDSLGRRVSRLSALADPLRRALYHFVAEQPGVVSREQAATGLDVPHHTAKFHLDRLVDEGLLVAEFRRLTGRSGPGAGRPAKVYRRASREVVVSLPHRRYDLAGDVLADALERSLDGTPADVAVTEAAGAAGARAAADAEGGTTDPGPERLSAVLAAHGYEPLVVDGELLLRNCPYQRLAEGHPGVVCGMNLTFVRGLAAGLGCGEADVEPDPDPAGCCVLVRGWP